MYQNTMTPNSADPPLQQNESDKQMIIQQPQLLARIADYDQTAVGECVENYGNLIWNLATSLTRSTAEAENAAQNIFSDIWQNAKEFDSEAYDERAFIQMIALRRLLKNNEQGRIL